MNPIKKFLQKRRARKEDRAKLLRAVEMLKQQEKVMRNLLADAAKAEGK